MKFKIQEPWRRTMWCAALAFLISRLIVFGVWAGVACLDPSFMQGDKPHPAPAIAFDSTKIVQEVKNLALNTDAGWYFDIVNHGYEKSEFESNRQANWAFFPLHPLTWKAATILPLDPVLAGVLLANLFLFCALVLCYQICLVLGYAETVAERAVYFLAFFPTSYFFSLPLSESLFLLLTLATVLAALKREWAWMAIFGACACATRLAGIFLIPAVALMLHDRREQIPLRAWLALMAMSLGLLVFMAVLWDATGNPFAFAEIQAAWGRHFVLPIKALGIVLVKPWFLVSDWNFRHLNFAVFVGGCVAVWWLWFRRHQRGLALFLLLGLLAPALTGSITSMARYGMALFPLAIAAGAATENRQIERVWFAVSVCLLVLMTLALHASLSFARA